MPYWNAKWVHIDCGGVGKKPRDRLARRHIMVCQKCGKLLSRCHFEKQVEFV